MNSGNWILCTVDDVKAPIRNAIVGGPFGSDLGRKDYCTFGVPVIRGTNMSADNGRFISGEFVFVSEEKANKLSANLASPHDLVFTQRGTVGQVAIVPADPQYSRFLLSQSQMKLTCDPGKADAIFIYYCFKSPELLSYLMSHAITTGVPHINLGILKSIPLRLPPLPEQRAIARILSSLDDKIELNRRMNATLEVLAQTLFRAWFVDFEPVKAKAAGLQPAAMDAETAALFPAEFETSTCGPIPKGWKVQTIKDVFDVVMGQSPPGDTYNLNGEGDVFFQGRADFGFRYPKPRVFCTAPTRRARKGSTLLSVRAPVGDINLAATDCCIGRGVASLRHKTNCLSFGFYTLQGLRSRLDNFNSEGTVFGSINKESLAALPVVVPPEQVLLRAEQVLAVCDSQIEINTLNSRTLADIRDSLLPRLISGQLRVPDALQVLAPAEAALSV